MDLKVGVLRTYIKPAPSVGRGLPIQRYRNAVYASCISLLQRLCVSLTKSASRGTARRWRGGLKPLIPRL